MPRTLFIWSWWVWGGLELLVLFYQVVEYLRKEHLIAPAETEHYYWSQSTLSPSSKIKFSRDIGIGMNSIRTWRKQITCSRNRDEQLINGTINTRWRYFHGANSPIRFVMSKPCKSQTSAFVSRSTKTPQRSAESINFICFWDALDFRNHVQSFAKDWRIF